MCAIVENDILLGTHNFLESITKGSLSTRVFETRTATGADDFAC